METSNFFTLIEIDQLSKNKPKFVVYCTIINYLSVRFISMRLQLF